MTAMVDLLLRSVTSEKLRTSYIVVTVAGTQPKSISRLKNRLDWQVSGIDSASVLPY